MSDAYERDLEGLRCCTQCLEYKPRNMDNFFRDGDGPNGWSRKCKPCDRQYQRERREAIYQGEREVRPVRPTDGRLKQNRLKRRTHPQITDIIK